LDKLTTKDNYKGNDQILAANGTGVDICSIGHAIINTLSHTLHLNNVLHVPNASKNLIYVHRFSNDNHASLEYFPHHFLSSIWIRGRSFWKAHVKMAYIQFQLPRGKSSLLSSQHRSIGIVI
jgi:hypothetical protein